MFIFAIVVTCDSACSNIALLANLCISDVSMVVGFGILSYTGLFHFNKIQEVSTSASMSRSRRLDVETACQSSAIRFFRPLAVFVSNLARIGAKICENAFRTIPNILFFDAEKKFFAKFLDRKFFASLILQGFGRRTTKRTSPSARASNFALD